MVEISSWTLYSEILCNVPFLSWVLFLSIIITLSKQFHHIMTKACSLYNQRVLQLILTEKNWWIILRNNKLPLFPEGYFLCVPYGERGSDLTPALWDMKSFGAIILKYSVNLQHMKQCIWWFGHDNMVIANEFRKIHSYLYINL